MTNFEIGNQPCDNFKPQIEHHEQGCWTNVHECYKCGGKVSFCMNCHFDHHDGGYETCKEGRDTTNENRR